MKHRKQATRQEPTFFMNIPQQIGPQHGFDPRLTGFPLNLLYTTPVPPFPPGLDAESLHAICAHDMGKIVRHPELGRHVRAARYDPAPASFAEDEEAKQLMYYPWLPSRYSVRVVYHKKDGSWSTFKYRDDEVALESRGGDFRQAMAHATLCGADPEEAPENWAEQLFEVLRQRFERERLNRSGAAIEIWPVESTPTRESLPPDNETTEDSADPAVAETCRWVSMPSLAYRLEEVNFPSNLADSLAGKAASVEVYPEEVPASLIDPEGDRWNNYRPVRVIYTDADGRQWRLPRRWLPEHRTELEPRIEPAYPVLYEHILTEELHLPSVWDLWEINIPPEIAVHAAGKPTQVRVRIPPGQVPEVSWRDSSGATWRIPHDWRRRRVRLPSPEMLASQGVARDVAHRYGHRIVSVNYHPGSLCCLPQQYRFRDEAGNRWPVRIQDCLILGYGDAFERVES